MSVKEITVEDLKKRMDAGDDFQLIDVREAHETEIASIGGQLIPVGEILHHVDEIATDKDVIVYCRSGRRSANAIMMIQDMTGQDNLYNVTGGILEWSDKIDSSIKKY